MIAEEWSSPDSPTDDRTAHLGPHYLLAGATYTGEQEARQAPKHDLVCPEF